ncbi:MAG: hypothetical protein UZ21_OP11001000581 [Microgenomates bacterium OLB22]|nr:MAG: hypothetical protein UZ21_OP11001000581 [Microgenomates bacterium OLB22]
MQVVVVRSGKISGIHWTRGHILTVDVFTQKILLVEESPGWTERELRRDALQLDSRFVPKVGDPAPDGWNQWRTATQLAD